MDSQRALWVVFVVVLAVAESHNHHRGYSNKVGGNVTSSSEPSMTSLEAEEERTNTVQERNYDVMSASQDAVNTEVILMLRRLTEEVDALRTQATNLKLQNHLVYKTLRRWQSKCTREDDGEKAPEKELKNAAGIAVFIKRYHMT
jgi:hypothetical protein